LFSDVTKYGGAGGKEKKGQRIDAKNLERNIPRPLAAVPKKPFCWLFWSDMVDVCVCVCVYVLYITR